MAMAQKITHTRAWPLACSVSLSGPPDMGMKALVRGPGFNSSSAEEPQPSKPVSSWFRGSEAASQGPGGVAHPFDKYFLDTYPGL